MARSYSDELPVYVPEAGYLRKGDRIRITDGRFKGVEASVVIQPGVGEREVMVCVDNWMWVPLLRVQPGEYEVISLAEEGKHVYTRLDNFPDTKWSSMRRWAVIGGMWALRL